MIYLTFCYVIAVSLFISQPVLRLVFLLLVFVSSFCCESIVTSFFFFFFHFTKPSKVTQPSMVDNSRDLESDYLLLNPSFFIYY